MDRDLPQTFQMRFNLNNEQDAKIARFLREYPWSKTQKVKEILLLYIEGKLAPVTGEADAPVVQGHLP